MASPFARLSYYYSALGAEAAPAAYPFGPPEPTDEALRRFAERLRGAEPASRASLTGVLRAQATVLPWSAIHSSWLEPLVAGYEPQWRLWALAQLPSAVRAQLEEDRGAGPSALLSAQAPSWWPAYFAADVKRRLRYPDLPPLPQASGGLPGVLWERQDRELAGALALYGTRGIVSAARRLPRAEAQSLLWRLPQQCQAPAQQLVAAGRLSPDPFWAEVFERLAAEFPELEARLLRMGLADWLRVGLQRGQPAMLRRLAFRLPRRWGEWMLGVIERRPDWLERPLAESAAQWDACLAEMLESAAEPKAGEA